MNDVAAANATTLDRWSSWVVRCRYVVCVVWVIASASGLWASLSLSGLLTTPLAVPGTASAAANNLLLDHFGEDVAGSFTVVVPVSTTGSRPIAHDESVVVAASRVVPTSRVVGQQVQLGLLISDITTTLNLSRAASETPLLREALATRGLSSALVTGPPALQHDLTPVLSSDLRHGEIVATVLALVLLLLVLGLSTAVLVPLLVAGATIAVDIGVVFVVAHRISMVLYTPNVVALIALGLAVDYSLLVVHRFRHEVGAGTAVDVAVRATMRTAGRTVMASSAVVAVGLAVLACVPVPFLRSLGVAGLVVPVVALLSALTLQPALLAILGRAGVTPVAWRGVSARATRRSRWGWLAAHVVARPRASLVAALTFLGLASLSIGWLQLTPASSTAIPRDLPSARALALVGSRVGLGAVSPDQVVIDFGHEHAALTPSAQAAVSALATKVSQDPDVVGVAIGEHVPFVVASGRYEQILVFGSDEFGAVSSQQLVDQLRSDYVAHADLGAGVRAYVGGAPAQGVDFLDAVYGAFPWVVLAALLLAWVLLTRAFRSIVLGLVSVVLNVISVISAMGLVVLFTRFGVGSALLGSYRVSQIEGWVPVFLFAVLFGLSMDYEVFLVRRMREFRDAGASTNDAIVSGMAHTGGVVSAAALILVASVSGLALGHVGGLQELGAGLGLGILLDASIVRGLLLPSVMALLGRWNWWLPSGVARLLRTTASPLEGGEAVVASAT